jgi:hypothetical protein
MTICPRHHGDPSGVGLDAMVRPTRIPSGNRLLPGRIQKERRHRIEGEVRMDKDATPALLAIGLLEAGSDRRAVIERVQDRFSLDRHDAITTVAAASALLQGARARRRQTMDRR